MSFRPLAAEVSADKRIAILQQLLVQLEQSRSMGGVSKPARVKAAVASAPMKVAAPVAAAASVVARAPVTAAAPVMARAPAMAPTPVAVPTLTKRAEPAPMSAAGPFADVPAKASLAAASASGRVRLTGADRKAKLEELLLHVTMKPRRKH
jgi:hypothetical protein